MTEKLSRVTLPLPPAPVSTDPAQEAPLLTNVLRRVLAEMFATYGGNLVRLLADANSRLLVAGVDTTPLGWEVWTGTAADAWSTAHTWTQQQWGLIVIATLYDLDFRSAKIGGSNTDSIQVAVNTALALPANIVSSQVKNHTGGSNAGYQVIALTRA